MHVRKSCKYRAGYGLEAVRPGRQARRGKVVGKVLEFMPDKKFSMSWKNTADPNFPDTKVTWMLEPDGDRTKVTLVHTGFEKGRWLDLHDGGWSFFAGRLVEYCQTGRVENRQMFKELDRKTLADSTLLFQAAWCQTPRPCRALMRR